MTATPTGALSPVTLKPLPERGAPVDENSLTVLFPEFDIQELPKASKAIAVGEESPPPKNGELPTLVPLELSSLRLLVVPVFVIHACPFTSKAMAVGALRPLGV